MVVVFQAVSYTPKPAVYVVTVPSPSISPLNILIKVLKIKAFFLNWQVLYYHLALNMVLCQVRMCANFQNSLCRLRSFETTLVLVLFYPRKEKSKAIIMQYIGDGKLREADTGDQKSKKKVSLGILRTRAAMHATAHSLFSQLPY